MAEAAKVTKKDKKAAKAPEVVTPKKAEPKGKAAVAAPEKKAEKKAASPKSFKTASKADMIKAVPELKDVFAKHTVSRLELKMDVGGKVRIFVFKA